MMCEQSQYRISVKDHLVVGVRPGDILQRCVGPSKVAKAGQAAGAAATLRDTERSGRRQLLKHEGQPVTGLRGLFPRAGIPERVSQFGDVLVELGRILMAVSR